MEPENRIKTRTLPKEAEPYKWKPGQSGNPGGRPRKAPISDAYMDLVREPLPRDIRSTLKLPEGATWAHAIARGQLRSAVKGNTPAAKEIADRIEGRVRLPVEVEAPEGGVMRVQVVCLGGGKELSSEDKQAGSQDSAPFKPLPR